MTRQRRPAPGGSRRVRLEVLRARLWRDAIEPRLLIVRQLPAMGRPLLAAMIVINIVLGLVPIMFIIATSIVVGQVPLAAAEGTGSSEWSGLLAAFLVMAGLFVAQQALMPIQTALGELVKRRIDNVMHDRIMAATFSTPGIALMEDSRALDGLQQAGQGLESNFDTPGMAGTGLLALIARYIRLAGCAVLVAVVVSVPVGLALAAAVMLFRHGNRGGLRKFAQVGARIAAIHRHSDYLRNLALSPRSGKEIRVFGLVDWLADRYEARYRDWLRPQAQARRDIYIRPYLWYAAVGLAVTITVYLATARSAATGGVSLTQLAIVLQATVTALMLGEHYPESDQATQQGMLAVRGLDTLQRVAAEHHGGTGDRRPVTSSAGTSPPAGTRAPAVRFERMSFHYPGSDRVVHDGLDLELAAGRSTAIVGVNGTGKTTLVKLLARLYEPTHGRITVDGQSIDTLPLEGWRRQLGVVFQDFVQYELSLADNIAFGAPHVPLDLDRVRWAAERADLGELIRELPQNFDTVLSRAYPGGRDLSGGQWQRVAIARSLYALSSGARVLILDEPTSALDVRSEAEFFDHFVEITQGVTTLLISHRFSSVRRADSIAVIEDGRVREQGSHGALIASGGRYAELFALQAERFAAGLDADGEPFDPDGRAHNDIGGQP
ncbi:MAG: ABC transporter ATP-binding protein [Umezawaea sp.]